MTNSTDLGSDAIHRRAEMARLTLKLRALRSEVLAAERERDFWDPDAARAQIRSRLDQLVERRRHALDQALLDARQRADAVTTQPADIEFAPADGRASGEWLEFDGSEQSELDCVANSRPLEAFHADLEHVDSLADVVAWADEVGAPERDACAHADDGVDAAGTDDEGMEVGVTSLAADVRSSADEELATDHLANDDAADAIDVDAIDVDAIDVDAIELPQVEPQPLTARRVTTRRRAAAPQPVVVTLDPDAFSKAFAAAFAALLDERASTPAAQPETRYVQLAPAVVPRRSFWSNVWHADVILSVLAMSIVLIVLIAWST